MIWDGTVDGLDEIRKTHPSARIYGYQRKLEDGSYDLDYLYGVPVLVIEDRESQPGRVFDVGDDVV
jgi:hypothetical protein